MFGTSKEITVDLCRDKRITTRAAQYDIDSREIIVRLTDDSVPYFVDSSEVKPTVKYKKSDGHKVINDVEILSDGRIKIVLTDQMCISHGNNEAEILLIEKATGKALHSMHFIVNTKESVFRDDEISSTDEYIALENALIRVELFEIRLNELDEFLRKNEEIRQANEEVRKENENNRIESENARNDAENVRITNENIRIENESIRIQSENERNDAEEIRIKNENERIDNELIRQGNEEIRKENEVIRQKNEDERIAGYTEMQEKLSEMDSSLTSHIENKNNPHEVNLTQLGIPRVENKSSEDIRNDLTKDNVTTALGYTPYTPTEVDNKFSSLETNIVWKETVDTYDDIKTTYPSPIDGWTVNVKDTDYTYRFDGEKWIPVSANAVPKATENVDGLLSKEDYSKLSSISNNADSVSYSSSTTEGIIIGELNISGVVHQIYAPDGNTSEIVTSSITEEPTNQKAGEYWIFDY